MQAHCFIYNNSNFYCFYLVLLFYILFHFCIILIVGCFFCLIARNVLILAQPRKALKSAVSITVLLFIIIITIYRPI